MDRVERFIKEAELHVTGLWIGGKYDKHTNKLEWIKSETEIDYSNFAPGEPNKEDTSCISLRANSLQWQASDCENTTFLALCEEKGNAGESIKISVILFFITLMITNIYS